MPTTHNKAKLGEIAKNVIMPGDPLRARFLADNYLENVKIVSNVRGIEVHTGTYKGHEVSIMASGMGMPSMMIYAYELFDYYKVENVIRIGTCGSYQNYANIKDIIFSLNTSTDGNIQTHFGVPSSWNYSPGASYKLLRKATDIAEAKKIPYHVGTTVCSDSFYSLRNMPPKMQKYKTWEKLNVLCSEMETYALYACAALFKKNALGLFTVSKTQHQDFELNVDERERSTIEMMEIALETLTSF